MKPIRFLLASVTVAIASLSAKAQCADSIRFRIVDEAGDPVAYAAAVAVNEADSTASAPAFSSESGDVTIPLGSTAYTVLKVQCMGFVPVTLPLPLASSTVALDKDPNMLGEVVVKSGPALRQKAGKFIFNPADLYKRTADAYTVLRFSPIINVSQYGVSIFGRSSIIHINGRDPKMSAEAVMSMLQALPPERIKKVEIELTAGADQSASMQGGIVNIVLDNPQEGYLGNASANISYDRGFSSGISSFNAYSIGKFRSTALLKYQYYNTHSSSIAQYDYYDTQNKTLALLSDGKANGNSYSAQLNFAYDFSKRSLLSIAFSLSGRERRLRSLTESTETIAGGNTDISSTRMVQKQPWGRPNYKISAAYTLEFPTTGGVFDVEASYTSNVAKHGRNTYLNLNDPVLQTSDWNYGGLHIKPTYKQTFNKVHNLKVGYSLTRYTTDKDIHDPLAASHFIYTEMINSVFADWSASWSEVFYTRLGMRVENTDAISNQLVGNQKSTNNYTDFVPSLTIGANLPCRGDQSLRLSVNRYLSRPLFSRLDPFKVWSTPYTYSTGNPNLKPSVSWFLALNYSFLRSFDIDITSYIFNDSDEQYTYTDDEGYVVSGWRNFGSRKMFRFYLSYYKTIADIWDLRAYASTQYETVDATLQDNNLGYTDLKYSFGVSNNFTLSEKHHCYLELWYTYSSASKSITSTFPSTNRIELSLTKQFHNGWTISGDFSSFLGLTNPRRFNSPEFSSYLKQNSSLFSFTFTARYTLGKQRVKRADSRRYDSSIDSRI